MSDPSIAKKELVAINAINNPSGTASPTTSPKNNAGATPTAGNESFLSTSTGIAIVAGAGAGGLLLLIALMVLYKKKCSTVSAQKDDDLNDGIIRVVQVGPAHTNSNSNVIVMTIATADASSPHKPISMSTKNGEEERQGMNQQQQIEGQSNTNLLPLNDINNNNSKNDISSQAYGDRQTECKIMSFNDNHCEDDDNHKDVPVLVPLSDHSSAVAFRSTSNSMSNLPTLENYLDDYDDLNGDKEDINLKSDHIQARISSSNRVSYYKGGSSSSGSVAISASYITIPTVASTASAVHEGNDDKISNQMKTIESRSKSSGTNLDDVHPFSSDLNDDIQGIGSSVILVEGNNVVITEIVESDD
jgi:hypothetical protein